MKTGSRTTPQSGREANTLRGYLVVLQGRAQRRQLPLKTGQQILVGRSQKVDFRIDEPVVSRRHFLLLVEPDRCLLEDLGSENGTYVNGQRVTSHCELADRDMIQISTVSIRVRLLAPHQTFTAAPEKQPPLLETISDQQTPPQTTCKSCFSPIEPELTQGGPLCTVCAYLETADSVSDVESLLARHGERSSSDSTAPVTSEQVKTPKKIPKAGRFGPFVLKEILGSGGSGVVQKAVDERNGKTIALKLLLVGDSRSQLVRRFLQEARILASLRHPAIVRCKDLGCIDHIYYMALEYIQGTDLETRLGQHGPTDTGMLLDLAGQLCDAVHYAHLRGVIHRDLKLQNMILNESNELKIIDFGLSRALDAGSSGNLTRTDQFLGTPQYMAPEQIENPRSADQRCDIYAIGVILFRLTCGEYPYPAKKGLASLLRAKLDEAPRTLREIMPQAPPALEQIITQATAYKMDKRYPTAAALASDLRRALQSA